MGWNSALGSPRIQSQFPHRSPTFRLAGSYFQYAGTFILVYPPVNNGTHESRIQSRFYQITLFFPRNKQANYFREISFHDYLCSNISGHSIYLLYIHGFHDQKCWNSFCSNSIIRSISHDLCLCSNRPVHVIVNRLSSCCRSWDPCSTCSVKLHW